MHKTHGNRISTAYFSIRSPGFPFITKMNIYSHILTMLLERYEVLFAF